MDSLFRLRNTYYSSLKFRTVLSRYVHLTEPFFLSASVMFLEDVGHSHWSVFTVFESGRGWPTQ